MKHYFDVIISNLKISFHRHFKLVIGTSNLVPNLLSLRLRKFISRLFVNGRRCGLLCFFNAKLLRAKQPPCRAILPLVRLKEKINVFFFSKSFSLSAMTSNYISCFFKGITTFFRSWRTVEPSIGEWPIVLAHPTRLSNWPGFKRSSRQAKAFLVNFTPVAKLVVMLQSSTKLLGHCLT